MPWRCAACDHTQYQQDAISGLRSCTVCGTIDERSGQEEQMGDFDDPMGGMMFASFRRQQEVNPERAAALLGTQADKEAAAFGGEEAHERVEREEDYALPTMYEIPMPPAGSGPTEEHFLLGMQTMLREMVRQLVETWGLPAAIERETKKVWLAYLSFYQRHQLPLNSFFANMRRRTLRIPWASLYQTAAPTDISEDGRASLTPAARKVVEVMGTDRVAYVRSLAPSAIGRGNMERRVDREEKERKRRKAAKMGLAEDEPQEDGVMDEGGDREGEDEQPELTGNQQVRVKQEPIEEDGPTPEQTAGRAADGESECQSDSSDSESDSSLADTFADTGHEKKKRRPGRRRIGYPAHLLMPDNKVSIYARDQREPTPLGLPIVLLECLARSRKISCLHMMYTDGTKNVATIPRRKISRDFHYVNRTVDAIYEHDFLLRLIQADTDLSTEYDFTLADKDVAPSPDSPDVGSQPEERRGEGDSDPEMHQPDDGGGGGPPAPADGDDGVTRMSVSSLPLHVLRNFWPVQSDLVRLRYGRGRKAGRVIAIRTMLTRLGGSGIGETALSPSSPDPPLPATLPPLDHTTMLAILWLGLVNARIGVTAADMSRWCWQGRIPLWASAGKVPDWLLEAGFKFYHGASRVLKAKTLFQAGRIPTAAALNETAIDLLQCGVCITPFNHPPLTARLLHDARLPIYLQPLVTKLCGLLSRRRVPWRTIAVSLVGEHQWTAAKGLVLGTHGSDPRKKTGSRASQRAKTQRGAVASMTRDVEGEDEQEQRHGGTILAAAVMELELALNMRRQTQLYGTFPNAQGWPTHVLVPSLILVAARLVWPVLNSNPPAIAQNLDGSSEGDESDERPLADTADDDRPPRRRVHPSSNDACGRLMANMPENRELFHTLSRTCRGVDWSRWRAGPYAEGKHWADMSEEQRVQILDGFECPLRQLVKAAGPLDDIADLLHTITTDLAKKGRGEAEAEQPDTPLPQSPQSDQAANGHPDPLEPPQAETLSPQQALQRSYGAYESTLTQQFPEPRPPIPTQWRSPARIKRLLLGLDVDASSDDSDDGDSDDHNRGEGDGFGSHHALPFLPLPHKDRLRPTAERLQGETEGWGGRESEKAKMKKQHHRRILREMPVAYCLLLQKLADLVGELPLIIHECVRFVEAWLPMEVELIAAES
ncbi:unnamed protein product [Vitrella brassicaformis CCMP3155]|uniref:Uncharacterized protein n=1 Tax=Vitrella brassicaformis (strain CCMP3155) TaxID=1169540 RepID=A0A0G4F3G0_VITBC|nr:unnamed protein product [Vitrella brassicaformis CCMP3155]|eukprot:CEM06457.1 unnamed protein product [Vitrella brassicaformis CCMP3155]